MSSATILTATCSAEKATKFATVLFGCYRKGDAEDPEVYLRAAVAVLRGYPESIVKAACDPVGGLPSRSQFLPTIYEIGSECERRMKPLRDQQARLHREATDEKPREIGREEAAQRRAFIADWRERQAVQMAHAAARDAGSKVHELDARKIKGELREIVVKANEKHLANLAERYRADPVKASPRLLAILGYDAPHAGVIGDDEDVEIDF